MSSTTAPVRGGHAADVTPVDPGALPLGARPRTDGTCSFCVWAPAAARIEVRLHSQHGRTVALQRFDTGYHAAVLDAAGAGDVYTFVIDGGVELPDPASRAQPAGVHGPSRVTAATFAWTSADWPAPDLRDMVIYELHVGTFTTEGTFDAIIPRLSALRELGVTAVELLPVAPFPGTRNWGYDGTFPFGVQHSYGGPAALKRLVDAAHTHGLHIVLDVVYNHLGPEGNYLRSYAPYFTDRYHTPWGQALNFDGADSDDVRRFFCESALQWIDEYRIDALRLDAIHAIMDQTAQPFLREITAAVHARADELGRRVIVIGESDLGDPRVVRPARLGGLGMDAQWLDDFHHALRTVLTGDATGYYEDYGRLAQLARAFTQGYVYSGEYSRFRRRRHGAPGPDILPRQFVVYAQNHDQVGNRMDGSRLVTQVGHERAKLAMATVLLSPFTPLLFMGEEYGEQRPFPYFVSHGEPQLVEAVRHGRREEFASFDWEGQPPDPQAETTFTSALLDWPAREREPHRALLALTRTLLRIRREAPAARAADAITAEQRTIAGIEDDGDARTGVLLVRRRTEAQSSILALNFTAELADFAIHGSAGEWRKAIDTGDTEWGGPGTAVPAAYADGSTMRLTLRPYSAMLLLHDDET